MQYANWIDRIWNSLTARLTRIPTILQGPHRARVSLPVALTLLPMLGAALLLGMFAQQRTTARALAAPPAPAVRVSRADFHSTSLLNGEDLELNLAISQNGGDCQAALNGGYCLRYAVVQDLSASCDTAVMAGYGVIPAADVRVTASSITITVDTSTIPHFVHTIGIGGPISLSWKTTTPAGKAPSAMLNRVQKATAQGGIASYAVPSSGVIATIIYQ